MGINETVELIATYGVFPVVLAVILVLICWMSKRQIKSAESQEQRLLDLTKFITQNVSPKEHTKEEEDESRELNTYITSQLNDIVKECNSSRAYCVAYHNGGNFINARNFTKCSIIAEAVDNVTRPIMSEYQNQQRALIGGLDNALARDGECYVSNVENLKEHSPGSYYLLQQLGTQAVYFKALVDVSRQVVVGFLAVDFTDDPPEDESKVCLYLSKKAQLISGAIQFNSVHAVTM